MRRALIGLGLLLVAAEVAPALAQTCVQDYRGRIVCGQRIQPYGGPSYYAPQYGPPPGYYLR